MTTNLYEGNKEKCYPYWKAKEGDTIVFGIFEIATMKVETFDDFTATTIEISNLKVNFRGLTKRSSKLRCLVNQQN